MRRRLGKALAVGIPIALVSLAAWGAYFIVGVHHKRVVRLPSVSAAATARCVRIGNRFAGLSASRPIASSVARFTRATGVRPAVVEYYSVFGDKFDPVRADTVLRAGAEPMVQWLPDRISLRAIGTGRYDRYLRRYADAIRKFGCPIMLSFGHEMNGPWWPWGNGRQSAASYRAAWRRIHQVFAANHASNVTWVWDPNVIGGKQVAPPAAWWPGSRYVDLVAMDGCYWVPRSTFKSVFAKTIALVRRVAPHKLLFIAETGAYPGPAMAERVRNMFHGMAAADVVGIVYLDIRGHVDWRLENNPEAAAAFRAGVRWLSQARLGAHRTK